MNAKDLLTKSSDVEYLKEELLNRVKELEKRRKDETDPYEVMNLQGQIIALMEFLNFIIRWEILQINYKIENPFERWN